MKRKRMYEDFEPFCKWHLHDGKETIDIYLKGFKKDQLKVQTNNRGILLVYGEKPQDGSKWSRFRSEIKLPKECDRKEIRARFSEGILSIEMPTKVQHLVNETEQQNINAAAEAKNAKEVCSSRTEQQLILKEKGWAWGLKISKTRAFKVAFATAAVAAVVALGTQIARLVRTQLKFTLPEMMLPVIIV